jgi:hypothetical protein
MPVLPWSIWLHLSKAKGIYSLCFGKMEPNTPGRYWHPSIPIARYIYFYNLISRTNCTALVWRFVRYPSNKKKPLSLHKNNYLNFQFGTPSLKEPLGCLFLASHILLVEGYLLGIEYIELVGRDFSDLASVF